MNVELLFISPKYLVMKGIRKCWKSDDLSDSDITNDILGEKDKGLIRNIIKFGHTSTLEHSLLTFDVNGISRALLQELSRHRIGVSPSVESTRYTMRKILNEKSKVSDVLVKTGDPVLDTMNIVHMNSIRDYLKRTKERTGEDVPNDIAKYGLVESYMVSEQISFNFRSFGHFIELRDSKRALWEIRDLAQNMLTLIPEDYMIFFEDIANRKGD